jgi:hypothetical protein
MQFALGEGLRRWPDDGPAGSQQCHRFSRRALLLAGAAGLVSGWLLDSTAGIARANEADTSETSKAEAIRKLPLRDLTAETRRKLMAVVERPSIYRRLPHASIECDPALYLFLIRNPEVVVNIWQLLGVSQMTAQRVAPYQWKGNDAAGTTCDVELVYGTDDLHVMYSDGYYDGTLLRRKITGRCVLLLQSGYGQAEDHRWYVANRLDVFLQIDNAGADVIARTLSPWVGKVADANFAESCKFAQRLSATAEQNGPGVQKLADKLTDVQPEVRSEFTRVATAVQQRAAMRDVGGGPASRGQSAWRCAAEAQDRRQPRAGPLRAGPSARDRRVGRCGGRRGSHRPGREAGERRCARPRW